LSQAYDIALLSQNPGACHVAADLAVDMVEKKTTQNKIRPAKAHVAHGPQRYIFLGLFLAGPTYYLLLFNECSLYKFSAHTNSARTIQPI
jgi:hypothetical protein